VSTTLWGGARANGVVVGNVVLGFDDWRVVGDDVLGDTVLGFGEWRFVGKIVLGTVVPVVAF
jgi:hypothetical protein